MFSNCPRCETGRLNSLGTCMQCHYTLRITCNSCGSQNIPFARYCGECGTGTNTRIRFKNFINQKLSFIQQIRIKKFAAGAAFGTILAIFAFGTNGMTVKTHTPPAYIQEFEQVPEFKPGMKFSHQCISEISAVLSDINPQTYVSTQQFEDAINLLLQYLKPVSIRTNKSRFTATDFESYRYALANFPLTGNLSRGAFATVAFNILSDLNETKYRDFSEESLFDDIPKFHFLAVPATGLKKMGLNIGRSHNEFGISDPVSSEAILNFSKMILHIAEQKITNLNQA